MQPRNLIKHSNRLTSLAL